MHLYYYIVKNMLSPSVGSMMFPRLRTSTRTLEILVHMLVSWYLELIHLHSLEFVYASSSVCLAWLKVLQSPLGLLWSWLPRVFPARYPEAGICQSFLFPCPWCFHPLKWLRLLWSKSSLNGCGASKCRFAQECPRGFWLAWFPSHSQVLPTITYCARGRIWHTFLCTL